MIGYVVPHSAYPSGYHVNPKLPLPFINIASQKKFIALYHMAIRSFWNGLYKNTQNIAKQSWIWVKAVFGLKRLMIFLMSCSGNCLKKSPWRSGLRSTKQV
jgi:hypothetical protein